MSGDQEAYFRNVLQRSLLGEISVQIRAVTFRFAEKSLHFDAFIDGQISDDDIEGMSCVEAEAIALLPEDIQVTHQVHRLDMPNPLPKSDSFVYLRRE